MELSLPLEQIESLRAKARRKYAASAPSGSAARQALPFDPRTAGRLSEAQAAALEDLHRACAERLGGGLQALLHAPFELRPSSREQSSASLEIPREDAYLISFETPLEAPVLLQTDLALIFPLLDLLLGGSGQPVLPLRPARWQRLLFPWPQ